MLSRKKLRTKRTILEVTFIYFSFLKDLFLIELIFSSLLSAFNVKFKGSAINVMLVHNSILE